MNEWPFHGISDRSMGFRTSSFLEGPILQRGDILYGLIWDLRIEDTSRVASIFSKDHHALFRVDITDIFSQLYPEPHFGDTLHIIVDYCVVTNLIRTVFPCTARSFSAINTQKRSSVCFDSKGVALFEDVVCLSTLFDAKTLWSHNFGYIHGKDEMSELLSSSDLAYRVWIRVIPSVDERLKGKVFMLHSGKSDSEPIDDPLYKALRNKCECDEIDGKLEARTNMTPILNYGNINVETLPLLTMKEQLQVEARCNRSEKFRPPVLVGAILDIKSIRSKEEKIKVLESDRAALLAKKASRRRLLYVPTPLPIIADAEKPVERIVGRMRPLPMKEDNPPVIRRNWNFRTSADSNSRAYGFRNGNGQKSIDPSLDFSRSSISTNYAVNSGSAKGSVSLNKRSDPSMADIPDPPSYSCSSSSFEIPDNLLSGRRYRVYGAPRQNYKRKDEISENSSILTKTTVESVLILKLYEQQGDFQGLSRGVAWCPHRGFVDLRCITNNTGEFLEEGTFYSGEVKFDNVSIDDKCGGLYLDKVLESVSVSDQYQKAEVITENNRGSWVELLNKCEHWRDGIDDEKCIVPVDDYIQNIIMFYDDFVKFRGKRVMIKARISPMIMITDKLSHIAQWECVSLVEVSSFPQVKKIDLEPLLRQMKFPNEEFVVMPQEFFLLLIESELMSRLREDDYPIFEQLRRIEKEIRGIDIDSH